jgi:5-methylcytosine-specific restriction protein A
MPTAPLRYRPASMGHRPSPKRKTSCQRGYGYAWQQAAAAYLTANPLCVYCGGRADCVDHAMAHKGDMRLFWDRTNWRACCGPCNSRKAAKREGGFGH